MLRRAIVLVVVVLTFDSAPIRAERNAESHEYRELISRLQTQEAELRELRQQFERRGESPIHHLTAFPCAQWCDCPKHNVRRLPVVVDQPIVDNKSGGSDADAEQFKLRYYCDHDKGFVIRPVNRETHPFELKVNGWIQFRHVGFAGDVDSWTDNAGTTRPVLNRNYFDIERARLVFSGYALTPNLTYFLQLDGDTDGRETVDFFDYFWAYRFSDAFQLQMGKRKVPGTRQWLLGARSTRFVDRPLATDFFRPDRTVGLFAVGDVGHGVHYEAMIGNGVQTANLRPADLNDQFAAAATVYWDPLGDFGGQLVDFNYSDSPLMRVGSSVTYGSQGGPTNAILLDETDFVRLTDGTRLTETGALAPGVTVTGFDAYLLSVDAAAKWRGWSVTAEAYFRCLQSIQGTGPLPLSDLFQRGFFVEGGKFLIPECLDVNARYSQIDGLFGNASEAAIGFNWYPLRTQYMKVSFDVSDITRSPLNNTASEILVGDDGLLFRTQFQAEF